MRFLLTPILLLLISLNSLVAQDAIQQIQTAIPDQLTESHIRFLSADFFKGRDTGSKELEMAAAYIKEQFRAYGLKTIPGADDFYQPVRLVQKFAAEDIRLLVMDSVFSATDVIQMNGSDVELETASVIWVGFGMEPDLKPKKVKDKIVVARIGSDEAKNINQIITLAEQKRSWALESGAKALVELYDLPTIPFDNIARWRNRGSLDIATDSANSLEAFPHFWLRMNDRVNWEGLKGRKKHVASIHVSGTRYEFMDVKNVAGFVQGTHNSLKDEIVVVTAHYDHVGVNSRGNLPDSIYNGARDNALGTSTLLASAKYFGHNPGKRSILFLAVTAEEKGLLGSKWYAEHPLLPLNKTVFNLNTDGAGYHDTTLTTTIGFNFVDAHNLVSEASKPFNLIAAGDSMPDQNLFYRSDHFHFAQKGIPALTLSPGITSFNEEVRKYYHQPADEAESLNYRYIGRYARSFANTLNALANTNEPPYWFEDQPFYEVGNKLYGR